MKDVNLPRFRWKKERSTKLIKGNEEEELYTLLRQLQKKRSVLIVRYNILYPSNLKIFNSQNKNIEIIDNDNSEPAIRSDELRPRCVVAVNSNILRRLRKL